MPASSNTIYCEVCALPHKPSAGVCEDCGHVLGRAPDWVALRAQKSSYGRQFIAALVTLVLMVAANWVLFGGAGYVFVLGPMLWLFTSGYRYRVLAKRVPARATNPPKPS